MFGDRWKQAIRVEPRAGEFLRAPSSLQAAQRGPAGGGEGVHSRHSNGLEQFFSSIQGMAGLRVLDFSGASQANITFITNLGHKIYSEDLLRTIDLAFGDGDFFANQSDPKRQQAFLDQNLDFPANHFDGALAWDVFEFLAPSLLRPLIDRLHCVMRPGGYLLAMFHADERAETIPSWSYRIGDSGTLLLTQRGMRRPAQFFNNRAVEKLFQPFDSVKFFLTRDYLREVIVKR